MKSWAEKLNQGHEPRIKILEKKFAGMPRGSKMFIVTPKMIQKYVNAIPLGKLIDVKKMREDLAYQNNADFTCPLTTGIFLRIVAEESYERFTNDGKRELMTPFWRIINPTSSLAKKLTCGVKFLNEHLALERS